MALSNRRFLKQFQLVFRPGLHHVGMVRGHHVHTLLLPTYPGRPEDTRNPALRAGMKLLTLWLARDRQRFVREQPSLGYQCPGALQHVAVHLADCAIALAS